MWIDEPENSPAMAFIEMMNSFNLSNRVNEETSMGGHILDLVFSDMDCDLVQGVYVDEICSVSPVHELVTFCISYTKETVQKKIIMFRQQKFSTR